MKLCKLQVNWSRLKSTIFHVFKSLSKPSSNLILIESDNNLVIFCLFSWLSTLFNEKSNPSLVSALLLIDLSLSNLNTNNLLIL